MAKILVNGDSKTPLLPDSHHQMVISDGYSIEAELAPHIQSAAGYVVLPGSDPLLTFSKIVDKQYASAENGMSTFGKPLVIYSPDDNPNPFIGLVREFIQKGFVKQAEEKLYSIAKTLEEIPALIHKGLQDTPVAVIAEHAVHSNGVPPSSVKYFTHIARPKTSIAVFCSASTKDPHYLDMAWKVGEIIATQGWGVVFGAGNVSMMGNVALGAKSKGGVVRGHTTPVFYETEFKKHVKSPKEFIDELYIHPDIYVRMSAMFKQSDALVVLPGGLGTVQEMFSAFAIKDREPSFRDKPIVLVNDDGFYDSTIALLERYGHERGKDFIVVPNERMLEKYLAEKFPPGHRKSGNTSQELRT